MIRKVQGDLLKSDVQALVNTVNTVGVMGRGIALQFKRAYPENYEAYRKVCEQNRLRPGTLFTFDLNQLHNPRYIINFPTKRHWKGKSRIEDIESGLEALVREINRLGIESIALPPLGCGLGGLEWNDVYRRIDEALGDLDNVEVLVFEPTGAPKAEDMKTRTMQPRMTPGRAALLALMKRYLEPMMDEAVTMLELHKLMYFMQEAGEPLRLKYVKGRYGPYAKNLHHVLDRIEGHFIIGFGEGTEAPGKTIKYKEDAVLQAEQFLQERVATRERLSRVSRLIEGFETPYGMELLASVHWVACRENTAARKDVEAAVKEIHNWSPRKRKMFRDEHLRTAWNQLRTEDWL